MNTILAQLAITVFLDKKLFTIGFDRKTGNCCEGAKRRALRAYEF